MGLDIALYAFGSYFLAKGLMVLFFKKGIMKWAARLLKKKRSINSLIALEIVLGLILIAVAYFFS